MTEKIQITSEEDVLVYEDRVERVRCEMFQMVLINRVMERRELELPASGDEIREVYDQLKGKKGARRIEIAELTAKDLYRGTKHISLSELTDPELVSDETFRLVIASFLIRRHGAGVLEAEGSCR